MSWKDEEQPPQSQQQTNDSSTNGLQQSPLQQVSTVMETPTNSNNTQKYDSKRKRGRPPIDDYDQQFQQPKIMNVTGNADETYSNDAMSSSEHDLNIWEEDQSANEQDHLDNDEPRVKIKKEMVCYAFTFSFHVIVTYFYVLPEGRRLNGRRSK